MTYVFAFLVSTIFFSSASALTCYNCTYAPALSSIVGGSFANCEGPVIGAEHVITCEAGETYCTVQNVITNIPGLSQTTVITRDCSSTNTQTCFNLGLVSTCSSSCTTDNCNTGNGSIRNEINFLFVILLAVLPLYVL